MFSRSITRARGLKTHIPQICKRSRFTLTLAPPDPILGLNTAFRIDDTPGKINVGVGAYRDEDGVPLVLPSVRLAEERIIARNENHEYLPIEGDKKFIEASLEFIYGYDNPTIPRIAGVQTLSGTGALRLLAAFLKKFPPFVQNDSPTIYVPQQTWSNHKSIFETEGIVVREYAYYDATTKSINFEELLLDLKSADAGSIFLFHACAHNPTGYDLNHEQWAEIQHICLHHDIFVVFDNAYQAFASGNPDEDAHAIRSFTEAGVQLAVCQSYAKNMGLYGERVGTLSIITEDGHEKESAESQLKIIARAMYSSPPLYGARIVREVLTSPDLYEMWTTDVMKMSERIKKMRSRLVQELRILENKQDWSHLEDQVGMFAYSGLTKDQCKEMIRDHHIYLTNDGRISMAGINEHNIKDIAYAIHSVTTSVYDI